MTLTPGTRLGPYEISGSLGAGGMGEVYRAHDSRLGRDVAVKVSAEAFSDRFEREAHAIAALNHPNICTLYDVGPDYLVMELVDGPTLADRLKDGPIPLDEALAIAWQIAGALEAAHDRGIVHRDLKPANINVKDDGTVKVLDFGLAKALGQPDPKAGPPVVGDDNSPTVLGPTISPGATRIGTIIGTAAYMAPEQAKGKAVDKRADIWAFGVVLWEMVTGRRLFAGESMSDTLAGVLKNDPDLTVVPPTIRRLLRSCLEKDPKRRLHDISDARLLLDDPPGAVVAPPPLKRSWLPWAVAALVTIALGVTNIFWIARPVPESRVVRFTLPPPPGTVFNGSSSAAVSPDGRYVVFVANGSTGPSLWLQALDSTTARPLPGTEAGNYPTWSPDSKSIVFYVTGGQMKRMEIGGETPRLLCDGLGSTPMGGGAWSPDGIILLGTTTALYRLSATSGVPQLLMKSDPSRRESGFGFPQFLPDGKRFLYLIVSANPDVQGTYLGSLERPNERVRILGARDKAIYAPQRDGALAYLLFLRDQSLLAQRFDVDARPPRLDGEPMRVTDGFTTSPDIREGYWLSDAGLLVYRAGGQEQRRKLTWMTRDGKRKEAAPEGLYQSLRISPDGKDVALDAAGGVEDLWRLEFARGAKIKLTDNPTRDVVPVWSPDGSRIAFMSNRTGVFQLYWKDARGGGPEEQLTTGPNPKYLTDWSRDGRFLVYYEITTATKDDLWAIPVEGDRKPILVRQTSASEHNGVLSRDGNWIAYNSDENTREQVYIQAFPTGSAWPVSSQGGNRPKWGKDGKELFYLSATRNAIMSAAVRITGAGVETDAPVELIRLGTPLPNLVSPYDVSADGQRFLVLDPVDQTLAASPLTVVLNWRAGVKN